VGRVAAQVVVMEAVARAVEMEEEERGWEKAVGVVAAEAAAMVVVMVVAATAVALVGREALVVAVTEQEGRWVGMAEVVVKVIQGTVVVATAEEELAQEFWVALEHSGEGESSHREVRAGEEGWAAMAAVALVESAVGSVEPSAVVAVLAKDIPYGGTSARLTSPGRNARKPRSALHSRTRRGDLAQSPK